MITLKNDISKESYQRAIDYVTLLMQGTPADEALRMAMMVVKKEKTPLREVSPVVQKKKVVEPSVEEGEEEDDEIKTEPEVVRPPAEVIAPVVSNQSTTEQLVEFKQYIKTVVQTLYKREFNSKALVDENSFSENTIKTIILPIMYKASLFMRNSEATVTKTVKKQLFFKDILKFGVYANKSSTALYSADAKMDSTDLDYAINIGSFGVGDKSRTLVGDRLLWLAPMLHFICLIIEKNPSASTVMTHIGKFEERQGAFERYYEDNKLEEILVRRKQYVNDALAYIIPKTQSAFQKSMIHMRDELEVIERQPQYLLQDRFNCDLIASEFLHPVQEKIVAHKDIILASEALSQQFDRLGLFEDFNQFETMDTIQQTKYLHCMSIVADIMNHIEENNNVPLHLIERCMVEWPQ